MAPPGKHLTASCHKCGTTYRQSRSDQEYCSQKCGIAAWKERHPRPLKVLQCPICQKAFSIIGRRKYCSEDCATTAQALSKKITGGPGKGWSGGLEIVPRKTCQVCSRAFYAPPVQSRRGGAKFCSKECHGFHVAIHPELYPHTQGRRGLGGKREDLGGLYLRSSWEANWARYLNWLISVGEIVSWEYEKETFEFPGIKRGTRFYTPDFIVVNRDGSVEYHEVKGFMDPKSRTQLSRMALHFPEVKIVLVDKAYYRNVAKKISSIIPGWETVRGKAFRSD